MDIQLYTDYPPHLVYELSEGYFMPTTSEVVSAGRYTTVPHIPTQSLEIPLVIYEVCSVAGKVGYLFKPELPTIKYSTGLLIFSGSWRAMAKDTISFTAEELQLVFKSADLFIHNATNKCCILSCAALSKSIENVITAI